MAELSLEELQSYRPAPDAPADLHAFWRETIGEARQAPLNVTRGQLDLGLPGADAYRLSYDGWRGVRIQGWFICPKGSVEAPGLVVYPAYGDSRGQPFDFLDWAAAGFAVLSVDVRGQMPDTPDPQNYPAEQVSGWMTRGIAAPESYYYRAVYVDCLRAVNAMRAQAEVDPRRIGTLGMSQGGGLALAMAALDPDLRLAMADVPYLCNVPRALAVTDRGPYQEIRKFAKRFPTLADQALRTISYFDNLSLADRITAPVLMSVGLMDSICPPSTGFSVFNRIPVADKEIRVYPNGGHQYFPEQYPVQQEWAQLHLAGWRRG